MIFDLITHNTKNINKPKKSKLNPDLQVQEKKTVKSK